MEFKASWVQGYGGTDVSFINGSTVAFICGRHVKFHDVYTGAEFVYAGIDEAISSLAVHRNESVFAVSETSPKPRVLILSFPDFRHYSTLEDGAILDFHALAFAGVGAVGAVGAGLFASVSTHPDFRLTIWNYSTGDQLCFVNLSPLHNFDPSTRVSFSPANPSQLCLTTEDDLLLWNVERSDDTYLLGRVLVFNYFILYIIAILFDIFCALIITKEMCTKFVTN